MAVKYRKYDLEQTYFIIVSPNDTKNRNPLLKAVDYFIEEYVSIENFSKKVRNEAGGAPAVHPKMMLKILFFAYATGVYSSREIEDRLRWDTNYICLSGYQKVDHSTICNFILQYGEEIKEVFSLLVYIMAKIGYVTMDFIAIDGTKVKANVSKKFTGTVEDFENKRKRIEEKIEQILQHTMKEELNDKYKRRQINKLRDLLHEKEKIDVFLNEVKQLESKSAVSTEKINLTDPDARMVKDNDAIYMGYNCQVVVDEKAHVIVSSEVFNEASDRGLLQPMMEKTKAQTKNDLQNTEIGFDSGYFSSENLQYCDELNLAVYLPEGKGAGGRKQQKNNTLCSRDCTLQIDGNTKRLICPGGQLMETTHATKDRNNYYYKFYPKKEVCASCSLREKCYGNAKKKRFVVKKEYFDALPIREKMTDKLLSEKGKLRMADRACIIEHVFGEIKELFNFRRFMHRTLDKVRVIWTLVCIGYNLRKLAKLGLRGAEKM